MKKNTICLLLTGLIAFFALSFSTTDNPPRYLNPGLPVEERVEDLIKRMTIEEKIAQMTLFKNYKGDWTPYVTKDDEFREPRVKEWLKEGAGMAGIMSHTLTPGELAELNNNIQKILTEDTRLGIPGLIWGEGLHGFINKGATSFPIPLGIASTWDTALIRNIYSVIGKEARVVGATQLYMPVLGLGREPRWGRVGETFGEDPYLVGRVGASAIKGLQGTNKNIDKNHVVSTAKHFVAHSQPRGGINIAPGNFSERVIRENFMYPFEIAVKEARVKSVMPSYNEIDGIPSHINTWLLQDVLRKEWGFEGYIIGDLGGIEDLYEIHHVAPDAKEAAKMAITAGVDMDPVKYHASYHTLAELVREGEVKEELIDNAVRRILTLKFELGLFENPYADPKKAIAVYNNKKHDELALKAAEEAIILLKNENNTLPLNSKDIKKIAVIGPNAANVHNGSYSREPFQGVGVLEGIRDYANGKFEVAYAEGCKITVNKETFWGDGNPVINSMENDKKLISTAVNVALDADVVLLVLGGNESTCHEAWDTHRGDRDNLDLFGHQEELAKAIIETGKPVVALLLNERPLSVNYLAKNANALIEGWFLGQETGAAVANVLFGKVNPSGKLPITIPGSVGQLPCYYNKKTSCMKVDYIGGGKPLFPFGFGLSYTSFKYEGLSVSPQKIKAGQNATVKVTITNSGTVEGEEIVQLYIRDKVSSVTRPVKELKDFRKIKLQPGESKTVNFTITPDKLQFYNQDMKRVIEPGEFTIMAGTNSESFITTKLIVK